VGRFGGPTAADVLERCAPYLGGDEEVRAFVVGRALNDRLLYVVTERAVHVVRLGPSLGSGLRPRELVGSWRRGEVEVEEGIASIRVGPHRAKVRLVDRSRAAEVARLAGTGPA
jgi:hypothetical protein